MSLCPKFDRKLSKITSTIFLRVGTKLTTRKSSTVLHSHIFLLGCIFFVLRPWINQITLPNSCQSSCKITFLFYKISFWKFRKYNRRRWDMSVSFVWVRILQKISQLAVIVDKFSNFFQNFIVFCSVHKIFR